MKIKFFFLLLLIPSLLCGQETQPPPPQGIEPIDLSPTWWDKSIKDPAALQKNFDAIVEKVEPLPESLSEENRKKAETLVNEIKLNLQAYLKSAEQPLPSPPVPGAIAETYSINDLTRLNGNLVRQEIELASRKEERNELQNAVNTLQERADFIWKQYTDAEKRSEARVLYGLEVISLFPSVEAARKKISILDRTISNAAQSLQFLREEIKVAETRLVIPSSQQTQLARQIEPAQRLWQEAKISQQNVEATLSGKFSDEATEKAKTDNQFLQLQQIQAGLLETEAHNRLLRTEILYSMAEILNEPERIHPPTLSLSLKDWSIQLASFKSSLKEWESQTNRIVSRNIQLLSVAEQTPEGKKGEDKDLLQNNIKLGQENLLKIQTLEKEVDESRFLFSVVERKAVGLKGTGERWISIALDYVLGSFFVITNTLGTTLFHIGAHPVTPLAILRFFVIMIFTWWMARLLAVTLDTVAKGRKGIRKSLIYRINTLIKYVILLIGLMIALTSIGFDFSNLVLLAGAFGIGIGFGLQTIFNNFISGIIILFQSHLKIGDFVELDSGVRGEIREINVRSTVLTTNDGLDVIVPNSEMISSRIVNWTLRDPYRRVHIPFSVAYGSDIDEVSRIVIEAAKKVPSTLQKVGVRDPQVFLLKFGDNALEMELVVWVNEKWTRRHRRTVSEYLWAIEKALRKGGFEIPFPQRDIHIKTAQPTELGK